MTTLPQTTIRVPRPPAPSQMMLPGGPAPAGTIAATQGSSTQMNGADVWRVIRGHMWLILGMVCVAAVIGYATNWYLAKNYSRYTATGYIQILPQTADDPLKQRVQNVDHTSLNVEQRTQAQLLKHQSLITRVLQNTNSEIRNTAWFQQFSSVQEAKKDLMQNFVVTPIGDSKLISIAMSYSRPKECKIIVEEIVNQHLKDQQQINADKRAERTVLLNNMKRQYQFKLRDTTDKAKELVVQLNIQGLGTGSGRISALDLQMQSLINTQLILQANSNAAKNTLDTITAMQQGGFDPPKIEEIISQDPEVASIRHYVAQASARAAETARLGENHPVNLQAQKSLEAFTAQEQQLVSAAKAKARVQMADEARNQVNETQRALKTVSDQVNQIKHDMGDLSIQFAQFLTLKDEETATRELLKQVTDQIEIITQMSVQNEMGTVAWATKPEIPDTPTFPNLPVVMSTAILLGLGLSLGIAFLREMTDTSVKSPRDLARVGQMNLLGMIPHEQDDPQASGARLPLVIFEAPHSLMAENFRQLRTRLQHAASLDTTRSILVSGPSPSDGISTVACNLAAGLALNGRRILLVDANFRRPELHRVFDLPNDKGFSDVLNSVETFDQTTHETQVPNLAVLTSGPKPTNATELLESQLLIDFIEKALEEFDHVIFDSGPLLFVSESVALAPRVDGVVTVVRAKSNSRGLLQRMRDSLRQVKAEHLGVVLNGVRAQGGGYYGKNIRTYYDYQNSTAADRRNYVPNFSTAAAADTSDDVITPSDSNGDGNGQLGA